MAESLSSPNADLPAETGAVAIADKGMRWFELVLVLLVAVGSSTVGSFYIARADLPALAHTTNLRWILGTFHELTALLLLFYVLRRRGLGLRALNLRWSLLDCGSGFLLAVTAIVSYMIGSGIIHWIFELAIGSQGRVHTSAQIFGKGSFGFVPYFLLSPIFEELIVRAYLMTEITELTGSAVLAAVVSAAVQTSYHLYYGWSTALGMFFLFLTFAVYFAVWKRSLTVIVAHELFDTLGLVHLLRAGVPF